MACDRFVWFENDRRPTRDEVLKCLENYIGYCGSIDDAVREDVNHMMVCLPGRPTSPFEGIEGAANVPLRGDGAGRWFEVVVDKGIKDKYTKLYVDVISREQDEFTMNVAQGFAELLARFWNGKLEQ